MTQPAARIGDSTAHGGAIVAGCPTVLIGNMPAARVGDMHACPMQTPAVPPIPHVGGPVVMGAFTVLLGNMPAARAGDTAVCVGPPDAIAKGEATVLIGMGGAGGGGGGGGGCSWGRGGGAVNSTMVSVSLRAYAGPRSFARPSRPATVTTCTLSASTHDDLPRRRPKMASSAAFGEGGGGSLMASSTPREKAARSGWRSARCRPGARGRSPA